MECSSTANCWIGKVVMPFTLFKTRVLERFVTIGPFIFDNNIRTVYLDDTVAVAGNPAVIEVDSPTALSIDRHTTSLRKNDVGVLYARLLYISSPGFQKDLLAAPLLKS